MKNLNFQRKGNTPTKDEIRKLIEVEKKRFFENGGVIEVLKDHIGPETPSCFTEEWEQPVVLGIPSEIDNMYANTTEDLSNFLNEQYTKKVEDY
jgi:hypothetical protein